MVSKKRREPSETESPKKLDLAELTKASYDLKDQMAEITKTLCKLTEKFDQLDKLNDKLDDKFRQVNVNTGNITEVQNEVDEMHKRVVYLETKALQTHLIIRNFPKPAGETNKKLADQLEAFFGEKKIEPSIKYARRLPTKDQKKPAPIEMVLETVDDVPLIFNAMRDTLEKKVSITKQYPQTLKKLLQEANELAYKARQTKGTKTRVTVTFNSIRVTAKKASEDSFNMIAELPIKKLPKPTAPESDE